MKRLLAKMGLASAYKIQQVLCPTRFLFVVGHMRSGSSLLTHILNTNAEISGYGETHLRYSSRQDLDRLVWTVYKDLRQVRVTRFTMDKVLHNDYLEECLFFSQDCMFLFLVREPEGTLRSLVRAIPEWHGDPEVDADAVLSDAWGHYTLRLRGIEQEARAIRDQHRASFLTYDQLINRTYDSFGMIEHFLGLRTQLSENYHQTRMTGRYVSGDTSPNIKKGYIDRAIRYDDAPIIDAARMDEASRCYARVTSLLSSRFLSLDPTTAQTTSQI
ncbi:sulfotransferase family protein [Tautonia plasticadhaerens]|uniref:Sulfotransferase domain-containing protein n=1 Tax=Tautonia plasticadhaerens TaxID=2527974 RepID=A0A518HD06_9BACT|nr:sulfotransferase domain-containing protein [Tautonia plasticadhaerens]QDV38556.1 hypothetical protein ElP_65110 [Tautonia plasticadhaerens]